MCGKLKCPYPRSQPHIPAREIISTHQSSSLSVYPVERGGGVADLARSGEGGTLGFRFARGINVRHTHQSQESFTLFIMLLCDTDGSPTEFIDFFCCAYFLCFVNSCFCLFSLGKTFRQLPSVNTTKKSAFGTSPFLRRGGAPSKT